MIEFTCVIGLAVFLLFYDPAIRLKEWVNAHRTIKPPR